MNSYVILSISMLCALSANIVKKHSIARFESKKIMRFLFNSVVTLACALSLLIISLTKGVPEISGFTLLLGILFGIITAIQFFFSLMAYERGPFSYTSVIISLSTIIPALSGYLIWDESIAAVQIIGMVLMLICFFLSVDFSGGEKKTSAVWFLYVFIAFLATGLIGVMQKWHQSSEHKSELDGFLITAFLTAFLFSTLGTAFTLMRSRKEGNEKFTGRDISAISIILMICCGICAAANNKMNLYLSGVMDSAVFFPVVNGGGMILSAVASLIIFKEKFGLQKWLGIIIGILAVILICNPF